MKVFRLLFIAVCSLGLCLAASAQEAQEESVSGSGGTLTAPTTLGQNITITGVQLSNGQKAYLNCPVTFFGASTYQWKWSCAKGTLTVNGVATAKVTGSMTLNCSGGGRYHATTCWHTFSGTAVDNDSDVGSVTISAKGGANNAPGSVTAFSASW
jgi:hypothetical protein